MAGIASTAAARVVEMLSAASSEIGAGVMQQQIAFDLAEKTAGASYPALYVYCEKLENGLREKFRTFSGRARMAVETRVSQDVLEGLTQATEEYADAVAAVLDAHRGTWETGYFYTGGYEVEFGPVKRGGKNFIQTAKITFAVEVSV